MVVKELLPNFWHVSDIDFLFVKNFIEKLPSASFKVLVYQKYLGPGSPLKSYNFTAWKVSVFGVILARIFPHSDWLRRDTEYLSVFSPNVGKCVQEWLQIRALFTQFLLQDVTYGLLKSRKKNIWNKGKKSIKIGQDQKTFISAFA